MLLSAAFFWQYILAIHIIAVVIAFGAVIAWPLVLAWTANADSAGALHATRLRISRMIVNPGLILLLASGIYLASDLHQWKQFYVQWGIAAIVVLGGLEGAIIARGSRELSSGGTGSTVLAGRITQVSWLMAAIVLVTIVLMSVNA